MDLVKYGTVQSASIPSSSTTIVQPMDYYSISSSFQHLVLSRQMELQNLIIDYIKKRFGIKSAMVNISILLLIINPAKFVDIVKNNIYNVFYYYIESKNVMKSILFKRRLPVEIKTMKMEINYIHDSAINHLYVAMDWYLNTTAKVVSDYNHILGVIKSPIEASSFDPICCIQKSQPQKTVTEIIFKNKKILFKKESSDTTVYTTTGDIKKRDYQILLWSTECSNEDLEQFCIFVANQYAKSKINLVWKQKMYTNNGNTWKDNEFGTNKRKISTVIMPNNANIKIIEDIRHFVDTEEWHMERGINYKKSMLFYGPPGTGKTSMIRAISYEIKRHIHFLNLSMVESDEQLNKLMSLVNFRDTIIILEDIDAMSNITHKRIGKNTSDTNEANDTKKEEWEDTKLIKDNKTVPSKLTLSGLLNQLDGLHNTHGMLLIMTSNHPEVLDDALLREGRVDDKILFTYCTNKQIYDMFLNFYGNKMNLTLQMIIDKDMLLLSPASVENAMKKHYKDPFKALDYLSSLKPVIQV